MLEEDAQNTVSEVFRKDLPHAGVIYIGRVQAHDTLFTRVVHLIKDPEARPLVAKAPPSSVPAPA
jgi:vitamin B12/bleomycin/antimicrobial peptide transport system ATP-binding/permease protein